VLLIVALQNLAIAQFFPLQSRFAGNFSPTYLNRYLQRVAALGPQTMFMGDGLLAGFRLRPDQTAVALLSRAGCACRNLAFSHGSPVGYYALALLMQARGVHPKMVVLEINQAEYNPSYYGYRRVPGAVGELAWPLLAPVDRAVVEEPRLGLRRRFERALAPLTPLFAMRADLREAIFGAADPKPPPMSAVDRGRLYAVPPLDTKNVSVRYLGKTLDVLHGMGTPVTAFAAPVNHAAFGTALANATYRANGAYLRRMLERRGVRFLDLDGALGSADFEDEVHLNASGQRHLAALLEPLFGEETSARATHAYARATIHCVS
jgi:hypothetical protein